MFFQRSIHAAAMAAAFLCCGAVVRAQFTGCIVSGANPTQLRSSGIAEKTGDVLITCQGGTITAAGQRVPTATLTLTFNTSVTSRLLAPGWSDALLLINEPLPANQRVCGTPGDTLNPLGGCTILGTAGGLKTYDGSPGHPNVFQGMVAGPNSLVWLNVPLDPSGPDDSNTLILRFVNLRVDAAAFGAIAVDQPPVPVSATFTTTGTLPAPVKDNPQQIVSQAQASLRSSAPTPTACAPEAATLSGLLGKIVSQVNLQANKGFAAGFKPRTPAFVNDNTAPGPANQDVPGQIYNSEVGFFNSAFPTLPGQGDLARGGLADQGTRIAVRIANAPPGTIMYAPVVVTMVVDPTNPFGFCNVPGVARRITTNANGSGPFTPTPGDAAGLAPLVEQGNVLTAVYEVLSICPQSLVEHFDVPIFADAPSLGDATAVVGLAPFGVEPKTTSLGPAPPLGNPPIPRFVLPTAPGLPLTPLVCHP